MKHKHKDIEGSRRLFEIEVPSETVKKKYEEIFEHIKQAASIPGYRKGKAPRDLLEKHHGQRIKEDTIQDMVSQSFRHALRESQTETVGTPEVSDVKFDLAKGLFFKVKVDVMPAVKLKKYKGIAVKKQKVDLKPADVDKYLSVLQESNAAFSDVEGRGLKNGDYIVCDLECLVDDKPIYPKRKGVWIFVDKTNPVPGLVEGLTGQRIEETREVKTTLPKDFQDEKYRNKQALFKVNLLKIKEKNLPKLDEEFAKRLGKNNVAELKKTVEADMARKLENGIRQNMESQILAALLKEAAFSVPNELVERETKRLMELKKGQLTEEKAKEEAIGRVKLYFILDEIAKREEIKVADRDLDEVIGSLAKEYGKTKDELNQYYKKNNLLESLRDQLKENKVIEFLLENANIKEK